MKSFPKPDNRLYVGEGGLGKSTLARYHLAKFPRQLRFNYTGEPENREGAIVVTDKLELIDRLKLAHPTKPIKICWEGFIPLGDAKAFDWANRAAWGAGNLALFWDEIDNFETPGWMPESAYKIVHHGRHRRLRTFAIARGARDVARRHTKNCQRICAARTMEDTDIRAVNRLGKEWIAKLPGLPEYKFIDWYSQGKQTRIKKAPFP